MIRQSKPVVVYLAPKRTFQNLRSANDVMDLLGTATARVCDALSANLEFNTCATCAVAVAAINHRDLSFSFVDCLSFVVMEKLGIAKR
jgi:predicted nucleic acid-binding protein